jgi:hypothetical protein
LRLLSGGYDSVADPVAVPSLVLHRMDPVDQVFGNGLVLVIGDQRCGKSHVAESIALALGSKRLAIVSRRPQRWRHLERPIADGRRSSLRSIPLGEAALLAKQPDGRSDPMGDSGRDWRSVAYTVAAAAADAVADEKHASADGTGGDSDDGKEYGDVANASEAEKVASAADDGGRDDQVRSDGGTDNGGDERAAHGQDDGIGAGDQGEGEGLDEGDTDTGGDERTAQRQGGGMGVGGQGEGSDQGDGSDQGEGSDEVGGNDTDRSDEPASAAVLPADLCGSTESRRIVAASDCLVIDRLDGLRSGERLLASLCTEDATTSDRPRLEIVASDYSQIVHTTVRANADWVLIGRVRSVDAREKLRRQWGGRGMKPARWNELLDAAVPAASRGIVIDAASGRPHVRFLAVTTDHQEPADRFFWFSAPLPPPPPPLSSSENATEEDDSHAPVRKKPASASSRRRRFDLQLRGVAPSAPPPLSRLPRAIVGGIALFLAPRCAMRLYATNRAAHNDAARDYLPRAPTYLGYEWHPGGIALRVAYVAPQ